MLALWRTKPELALSDTLSPVLARLLECGPGFIWRENRLHLAAHSQALGKCWLLESDQRGVDSGASSIMRLERVQQKGVPGLLKDTVGQRYFLLPESKTSWTENTRFSCVFRTFGPVAPMAWHRIYPCCSSKMKTCDRNVIFHNDNFFTHKVSTVLEAYEAVLSLQLDIVPTTW